jgi:lipopolysaccharide biosynthesis protein
MKPENKSSILFNNIMIHNFECIDFRYGEILFPLNTKRRVTYNRIRKGIKIIKEKGWHQLILSYKQYLKNRRNSQKPSKNYQREYIENLFKSASQKSDEYVSVSSEEIILTEHDIRLIAFYLPQYYPIPENDRWWGKGFTDWTNVSKAVPQYVGHYQPHLPDELGFYDLRLFDVQQRQVELARQYGIYGFCIHYYWFHGKRLLEKPLDQFIDRKELDMPFCLCWANENWTRRWDGLEKEVLLEQIHSPENDINFIRDLKSFFADSRYIRIEGKPILIVYRVAILPDPKATVERWRAYCRDQGIGEIYLIAAQTFGLTNPEHYGFDAAVEFPPHTMADCEEITYGIPILNKKYSGKIWDFEYFVKSKEYLKKVPYTLFKGIAPGWDNTARKPHNSSIYQGSSPSVYKEWLLDLINWTYEVHPKAYRFIFINAWNEWAEGAHLEPDRKYGYGYLQSTADAILESRIREKP